MSQIQLGSLDYDEIRNELKTFLSDQEELKDYNFDGSIISTIVDLMAYNTMYYAFYSNMQANEAFLDTAQRTESLISLAKPLGYVVPHRKSATTQITLTGTSSSSNVTFGRYELRLTGSDSSGTTRVFYNLEPITLSSSATPSAVGTFYEAKELVLDAPVNVDIDSQKFTIFDTTVDPIGIRVKVNGREWRKQDGIDADLNSLSEVYFVEPSKDGYVIRMGGLTEIESGQIIGKGVGPGDIVEVTYFSSNGSLGNNITGIFGNSNVNIQTAEANSLSSGGVNSPNPDTIKFFAPRFFATQNRAVTAEDYRTIGSSLLGLENDASKINVFGGDDLGNLAHLTYTSEEGTAITDPESDIAVGSAGEVYVSYLNPDETIPSASEQGIFFNQLKTKSVAGLSLKYYPLENAELVVRIGDPTQSEIATFNSLFPNGYTNINSDVFANNGGRAFSSATLSIDANFNNLNQNKLFFKNKLNKNQPLSITPESFTPRPESPPNGTGWFDLSEVIVGEAFLQSGSGMVSTISAVKGETFFGTWVNTGGTIGLVFWDRGEIKLDAIGNASIDYGNLRCSVDVDFNAPSQNQTIYAPHNLYVTSKLENTL